MLLRNFIVFVTLSLFSQYTFSQGCSDAGFCTINSFQPHYNDSVKTKNNQLKIGGSCGNADNSINTIGNFIEFNTVLNSKTSLDIKITSLAQKGNNISVFGMSDILVNYNYKMNDQLFFTVGLKAPFSSANRTYEGFSLPMDYQSSLGTYDFIFGTSYKVRNFQFVVAFQQPIIQNNNHYLASNFMDHPKLKSFTNSTNKFIRSGDVLLRVSRLFKINPRWSFSPSILPIYHINNDKYYDFSQELEINGSRGLTLNGNLYLNYNINSQKAIQLSFGKPFVYRQSRPDGLTRSLVLNIEYKIKF